MRIGIMGSMPEEVVYVQDNLFSKKSEIIGDREFVSGSLYGIETVVSFSRWGKVASSITATNLITCFDVDCIIFTGVAGAISSDLNIGDIIIAKELYQHDVDAQPFFEKYQIPLTKDVFFQTDVELTQKALTAANGFARNINSFIDKAALDKFKIVTPKVCYGKIASGDQVITSSQKTKQIREEMPDLLAVEMEGAAVAQVCKDYKVPFTVIRAISDKADRSAVIDCPKFIDLVAKIYSLAIIKEFYALIKQK